MWRRLLIGLLGRRADGFRKGKGFLRIDGGEARGEKSLD